MTLLLQSGCWKAFADRATGGQQQQECSMKRILAIAFVLLSSPAHAFLADGGFIVSDLGNGQMEVKPRGGLSAPQAWCAVSDYAVRFLGMPTSTQIWRISEPPRKAGKSIVFSFSPEGAATKTGLVIVGADDGSISAALGRSLCVDNRVWK
jgi:hypothetical protein